VAISKEARAAISKSASVFVLYATSCANNIALQHKRKTLTATDVLDMGFCSSAFSSVTSLSENTG